MQFKLTVSFCLAIACLGAEPNPVRILETAPLRFEPAAGANPQSFLARGTRYQFQFTAREAVLRSGKKDVRLSFAGANAAAKMEGTEALGSTTNLYLGNDPAKWRRAIPNYGRVEVRALYSGVDLAYYGNGEALEYDLTVQPGADARQIRLRLTPDDARMNGQGDLVSDLIGRRPVAYQTTRDGAKRFIASSYRKNADGTYGFRLGDYDHTRPLVIDPVLVVAQYFAGSYQSIAYGIGHDSKGLIYIGGTTQSTDLPLVGSSYQSTEGGDQDLFLAIVNPALPASSQVIYVTYIGGTGDENFGAMTVDAAGDVYMTGTTGSTNFPMQNAAQTALGGSNGLNDAFVLWMSPTQSLTYSTYFGGSEADSGTAIAVASNGWIYIGGDTQSTDLPNSGGFQAGLIGTQNMFLAIFNPSASGSATKQYSIYIGGTHFDEAFGIAVASDGSVWLAGGTSSPDIWIEGNPYQDAFAGGSDAYIAHINPALGSKALLYASFLGGSGIDEATSLVLDPSGRVILSGYTLSQNFPVTSNAVQTKYGGDTDAFVAILDTVNQKLVYSTYFGGEGPDAAMDLKEDAKGVLYVAGYTESGGLPSTSDALQADYDGYVDAFALKLSPANSGPAGIDYFSYLGSDGIQEAFGADFDSKGNMYLVGYSSSDILSRVGGPGRPNLTGNQDAFVIGFPAGSVVPNSSASVHSGRGRRFPYRVPPHR